MKCIIRRFSQRELLDLQWSCNLEELTIPEILKKGYMFLQFDSGPQSTPNRFLIFSTDPMLDVLSSAAEANGDSTLKIPPTPFSELCHECLC